MIHSPTLTLSEEQKPNWGASPCDWHKLGSTPGIHTERIQRASGDPFLGVLPSYVPVLRLTHSPVLDIPRINSGFLKADSYRNSMACAETTLLKTEHTCNLCVSGCALYLPHLVMHIRTVTSHFTVKETEPQRGTTSKDQNFNPGPLTSLPLNMHFYPLHSTYSHRH